MTKVLYPGSFDPMTKGHMDIVARTLKLFDEVVIAIMRNPQKKSGFFTPLERAQIIKELYKNDRRVKVIIGEGATVDVALKNGCLAMVRGIRNLNDFDYENLLQEINKEMSHGKVETLCLFSGKDYQFFSSSVVKELFALDKDITNYVEPFVQKKMLEKRNEN